MVKKNLAVILSVLALLFILFLSLHPEVSAHPGRTASDGCHYCRTNCAYWGEEYGVRHCHGGSFMPLLPGGSFTETVPTILSPLDQLPPADQLLPVVPPAYPPTSTPTPLPTLKPWPTITPWLSPTPYPTYPPRPTLRPRPKFIITPEPTITKIPRNPTISIISTPTETAPSPEVLGNTSSTQKVETPTNFFQRLWYAIFGIFKRK